MPPTTDTNRARPAADAIFAAINSGDLSCIPDCVTDDFVDHGSPFPLPPGPDGYAQILTFVTQVLALQYDVEDTFSTEDRIVIRAVGRGRASAQVHGAEFEGRPFEMATVHIYRTEGHRLAEHWGIRDELSVMRQIGALPPVNG